MEKELNCMLCDGCYTVENPPRLIECGHSLCEGCLKQHLEDKSKQQHILICPQDKTVIQLEGMKLKNFPKNLALVKLLTVKRDEEEKQKKKQQKQKEIESNQTAKESPISNNILPANLCEENETVALNDSTKETERKSQKSINLQEMCLVHEKPFEIICIKDKTKICSTCAIFGEHKGHDFKSIEEVQKDKINACDKILHIIQKKEILLQKLNSPQVRQKQAKQLQVKKQALIKQIKDNFTKLSDIIALAQKKALDKLSKTFEAHQPGMLDVKLPQKVNKDYQKWQEQAFKYIKAFESNDLQEQLALLNYEKTEQVNVVENGLEVLNQLEVKCEQIGKRAQLSIKDTISVEFRNDIDIKLATCCSILTKDEKDKEKEKLEIEKEREKDKGIQSAGISRAKIQEVRMERVDPIHESPKTLKEQEIQKVEVKEHRKISDHNDDLLIEEQKFEEEKEANIIQSNITIPAVSPLCLNYLDTSGSDAPIKTTENRKLDFSPIQKDNEHNESMNSSFLKNIGSKKVLVKGNILPVAGKRKSKLKLPEKYEKIYDSILSDTTEVADFTNAELGDQIIAQILDGMKGKKVKTLKLIRNKLTDEGMDKLWNCLENIITLNLSQNFLTDRFVDQLLSNLDKMPHLKSVILSQNKIKQRNVKIRIEEIKKHDITVSI